MLRGEAGAVGAGCNGAKTLVHFMAHQYSLVSRTLLNGTFRVCGQAVQVCGDVALPPERFELVMALGNILAYFLPSHKTHRLTPQNPQNPEKKAF